MKFLTVVILVSAFTTSAFAKEKCNLVVSETGPLTNKVLLKKGINAISKEQAKVGDYLEVVTYSSEKYFVLDSAKAKVQYTQDIYRVTGTREDGSLETELVHAEDGGFKVKGNHVSNGGYVSSSKIQEELTIARSSDLPSCKSLNKM